MRSKTAPTVTDLTGLKLLPTGGSYCRCGARSYAAAAETDTENTVVGMFTRHMRDCEVIAEPVAPIVWQYGPEWVAACYGEEVQTV